MVIEDKKNISKKKADEFPEHIPEIPYNVQMEREKEKVRKLGKKLKKSSSKIERIIVTKDGNLKKVNELNIVEQEYELIRCATNPIYFIETHLTIFDQTQGKMGTIVKFKLFDFQKDLINSYINNRFVVANKYRQAGISTTTCAYIAWYIMFNHNRAVAIVANKLETARDELMSDVVEFINSCPSFLRPKTGKESAKNLKDTQKLKIYDNDSRLGAFSSTGLRGMTPTLLFWDETAWTEKSGKFWTSAQPTLQTGGRAIMVSTPSGLDEVFYKTFINARTKDAKTKENNFFAMELWWFNDPRYTTYREEYGEDPNKKEGDYDLDWVKNKGKKNEIRINDTFKTNEERIKMMDDGWEATSFWFENEIKNANGDMRKIAQELLCSFLGSGDNFIAEDYLKRIEDNEIKTPLRQEYLDLNFWIWEDVIIGEDYIMALDASPGHGDDFSTINMLKTIEIIEEKIITKNNKTKKVKLRRHKVEQVAEYYGKVTPQMLAEIAYQFGKRYNNAYAVIDITGGYGVQSVEKLIEFGYPEESIHFAEVSHKPSRDRLQGYVKKGQKTMGDGSVVSVDIIPGFFIGNNRASVLLELQRAIHLEDVLIKSIRLLNELKTFVNVAGNRIADHKRSFHDDSIMGLAIGLYVLNFDMSRFKQSKSLTEKMLNAIITNNDVNKMNLNKTPEEEAMYRRSILDATNPYIVYSWVFAGLDRKKKN